MVIIDASNVKLSTLGAMQPGNLVDVGAAYGRCIIVRESDAHVGILNLTRDEWLQYFALTPRDVGNTAVCFSGVTLAVDLIGVAHKPDEIEGASDYSNMIAVSERGLSICVRNPTAAGRALAGYTVRRVSLADWSLLPQDNTFGEFQFVTDWRLLARFTDRGEWTELRSFSLASQ